VAPKSSATELAKNVRSANASKIDAINALIVDIGEIIERNDHQDGIPGTIILDNAALLEMIAEANRQIAGLSGEAA